MNRGSRLYLDTNVYNRLADALSPEQVRGLRPALARSGLPEPLLSPVVILELVQTADEVRREKLVYLVQHFCAESLLVEPEELVLDFIVEEMKRDDLRALRPATFFCRTGLARVWADVRGDWRKTFVVGENVRPGLKLTKVLYGWLHALLRQPNALADPAAFPSLLGVEGVPEAEALLRAVTTEARKKPPSTDKYELLRSHTWLLAAALVGAQFSLFGEVLDPLWTTLQVPRAERVSYVFDQMKFLLTEGPVLAMAAWLASQADRRYDQGNMFDGYNLMYMPYVDAFLTLDENLLGFMEPHKAHPTMGKAREAGPFVEEVLKALG